MPDNRRIWEYRGCKLVPISCYDDTWGKHAEPKMFHGRPHNRYWRIDFPDQTWAFELTKYEAERRINGSLDRGVLPYIILTSKEIGTSPSNLDWHRTF